MPKAPHHLVDRQFREWAAKRRMAAVPEAPRGPRVVTVTGEYGAMGDAVGRMVAERLGWQLFDRELIEMVARSAHTSEAVVETTERTSATYLDEVLRRFVPQARMEQSEYVEHLARVLAAIGEKGAAVVLGRGSNVLIGRGRAFRVRCIAPFELRVKRVAAELGLDPAEAERRTRDEDRRRARVFRSMLGLDFGDPTLYDLVVNTDVVTPEHAADVVAHAVRRWG